jgi:hypothetical protein
MAMAMASPAAHAGSPPPAPVQSPPEKALAVLDAHCAGCHQAGRTAGRAPHPFDNILSLDEVARDESLVRPAMPDASRLYQRLLAGHGSRDAPAKSAGAEGPRPEEIAAIRDWIEGLPPREELCRDRAFVARGALARAMGDWRRELEPAEAADTRFLSLAHLYNACASEARLAGFRSAVEALLARLSRGSSPVRVDTVGDNHALLAFRLSELGWPAEEWETLAGATPMAAGEAVRADWLAATALATGRVDRAAATSEVTALARAWEAEVGIARASAEAGLEQAPFAARSGKDASEIIEDKPNAPAGEASTIDLVLWTDRPAYKVGDLAAISVSVSRSCHLTLIDVDRDGKAIVLFPNDFEADNLIAPGVTVRVPGRNAPYQLRFEHAGAETLVAICQRKSRQPRGMEPDYEKQKFTILGDWRAFLLRNAGEHEPESRRSRRKPRLEPVDPEGPAIEGRAAIRVEIEEGVTP